MSNSKVIDISSAKPVKRKAKIRRKNRYDSSQCRHDEITLDQSAREVSCDECGAILDPFDELLDWISVINRHVREKIEWRQWMNKQEEKKRLAREKRRTKKLNKIND